MTGDSFENLLGRLRHGDEDAARQTFQLYARRLIGLAHVHLDGRIRQKVDAEDVVQSVFKSFFVRLGQGRFELASWDNLWSLLVVITLRKCGHKARDLYRQRQDLRKEACLQLFDGDSDASWQAMAKGPSPSDAAILAETVEQILGGLKERERRIVELHLQGFEIAEIQAEVQRSEYTVRDVLSRVRKRLERQRDDDAT